MNRPLLSAALLTALLLPCVAPTWADEPPVFPVWPGAVPGEKGDIEPERLEQREGNKPIKIVHNVSQPTLTLFKAPEDKANGAAVLICPGGGYNILAWDLEGTEVAEWLNSIGVTGVVLKYRVPRRKDREKHEAPLQDAQRAMSIVRSNAKEWGIDPARIGILGFSAGGHLSATACTNFDQRGYERQDDVDDVSCRPDFGVLVYPAYLAADKAPGLNPEIRVTKETPPIFFAHAGDDRVTPESSIRMWQALKAVGVPSELHVYASGGHGFGLRKSEHPCCTWPDRAGAWMKACGLLEKK